MDFDIIVVGGGHAGIEAASIAAKKNLTVLLITSHLDLIGQMSCNPAIGGIAKGNIVREIDALGGIMARLIDVAGIHFRMLNKSKGAAVWGPRAQADKQLYRKIARQELEKLGSVSLLQGMVKRVLVAGGAASGVVMESGEIISSRCLIIAAGTFLDGIIHIGLHSFPGGRSGEPPSTGLAESIRELGIRTGRLKTGTPPRIDGRTVSYELLTPQPGDRDPWPFSYSTTFALNNTATCWMGKSNALTHGIIRDNLDKSPLYTGKITSIGPRYCPSIEDKVVRFGDRDGHILFLEPETIDYRELYLNGLSTSLPFEVQCRLVNSILGLEEARILRPGYAIEYTFFPPVQLRNTLESREIKNLFFAGQINGTSGYEEAGCQGLVAGINATQRIRGEEELSLGRETSYIGVLIDDLVTRGTEEPYRMFTSRAEHRLSLRQDTSDERLMPIAHRLGFIDEEYYTIRRRAWEAKARGIRYLESVKIIPRTSNDRKNIAGVQPVIAAEVLKRPEETIESISTQVESSLIPAEREIRLGIEADIKYRGFISRQQDEIRRVRQLETASIPVDFNFDSVVGLLTESLQKMKKIRPATLGQAERIPGVTPADIAIIALHLTKSRKNSGIVSRETEPSKEEERI